MKKFWKKTEGFTLVELVVVIAILGILAGVGTVGYSGYVKKANMAADQQLLAYVNQAYAAACIENGRDMGTMTATEATITLNGEDGSKTISGITPSEYQDEFTKYFAGNENAEFKVIKTLFFDVTQHKFVDPAKVDAFTIEYGGGTITISGAVAAAMQESTFGQVMGADKLLGEMSGLTTMLSSTGEVFGLVQDEEYMRSLAGYLNVTIPEGTDAADIPGLVQQTLVDRGVTDPTIALTSGVVYYAAENIQKMDRQDVVDLMQSGDIYHGLEPNSGDEALRLAQASMAYGLYAAFVNSEYNKSGAESATNNPMTAIQAISGINSPYYADFQNYIKSEQGAADIGAYMSAMTLINDSKGNGATVGVLQNGFGDSELESLLQQVLGK